MHRTIVAVDVERFGRLDNPDQVDVRAVMYRVLKSALAKVGVQWSEVKWADRGDGVSVLISPNIPKAPLVESLPLLVAELLREHNEAHKPLIRLRMVLHSGEMIFDEQAASGSAVIHAFRLLDAEPLKDALRRSDATLALIVSVWFFEEVVHHSRVINRDTFRSVRVVEKETDAIGWIALPDRPYPAHPGQRAPELGVDVPHQLPAVNRCFVGRESELAALSRAVELGASGCGPVVISAIAGSGGIGKTCLAVYWAQQNLHRFPDGQLFVDLRGFSPTGTPMTSGEALRGFLEALDVGPNQIPSNLDKQVALFRTKVAGLRMVIVLDNAAEAAQVTPLLPGSGACTVLVTSRRRLTGLLSDPGAAYLRLDVLADADARELLVARLGAGRVAAEPAAVAELLACCAGFPLALSIVAGRAQVMPDVSLADLVAELRAASTCLAALDEDDPVASLPRVLSWSTRALTRPQGRLFALLGLAPGADISATAAANLAGLSQPETTVLLRQLVYLSLLDRRAGDRYAMHDLIRAGAATAAERELTQDDRDASLRRLIDHYVHTAWAADRLLNAHRSPVTLDPLPPGAQPEALSTVAEALGWFDAEHSVLLAAQHAAARLGWHRAVWNLAWTLDTFQLRQGHRHDNLAAWLVALDAAARLPEPAPRIVAHRLVGRCYATSGCHEEGIGHLKQALVLAQHHHDIDQEANTHRILTRVWSERGDDRQALEHATRARDLYRALDQSVWVAAVLSDMGWCAAQLGELDTAYAHCQEALALHQHHHHADGEAATLDNLGYIAHRTGHHQQAVEHYRQALTLFRNLGDARETASTLDKLGHSYVAVGHYQQAREVWREAMALYRDQGRDADAARVRQQLDDLDRPAG